LQGSLLYGIVTLALLITGEINLANTQQRVTNIAANATPTPAFNVSEYRTLTVDVSGTFVATLQVQTSINGSVWRNVTGSTSILNLISGAYLASGNITSAGLYAIDVSSFQYVRLISTAYTSGTAVLETTTVTTGNLNPTGNSSTSTVSGTVTANQGTLATGTAIAVTSAATTNASSQKATAGNLFEVTVSNPTATPAYVKFYNKASAPTVGTDVPVLTIVAPATSATATPSANELSFGALGKRFATGIAMAITAGPLATDTAVAVAGVQVHGTYI